jgi:plastocyanin
MGRRFPRAASFGVAAACLALVIPLAEGRAAPAAPAKVTVKMKPRACVLSRKRVPAGKITFTLTNKTKVAHRLIVAGKRSRFVKRKRKGKLQVTLRKPGRYPYTCKPKRKKKGIKVKRGTLVVVKSTTGPPPPPPGGPPPGPPPPPGGPPPPPQPPPPPGPPPTHRLGVRNAGGYDEFFDKQTGLSFVPRASIFVRRRLNETPTGQFVFSSSTFAVGAYNAVAAEVALANMQTEGYNAVRIFLDVTCKTWCLADNTQFDGLSRPYLGNLADFMRRAKTHGIYVLLAAEALPYGSFYESLAKTDCCTTFDKENVHYLTANGAEGHRRFWVALIQALNSLGAPLDYVWGYEIVAEQFYRENVAPLSFGAGLVTTGNGSTYDMAVPAQKQLMMDENLSWWAGQVRSGILSVDSTALVSIGFLWPKGPNPARAGDPRVVRARPVVDASSLDFFDIHLHPGAELTFAQYMQNFELTAQPVKPVVIGEFGAYKYAYPTPADAERILRSIEADSCPFGIDGWAHWSWDTTEWGTGELPFWEGSAAGFLIDQALGPRLRPDPCGAVPGAGNLALGKPVTASGEVPEAPATRAVDGLMANWWSSGGYPYQWIDIDLGSPASIARARLFVSQYPDGPTTHRILTRATTGDPWDLRHEFIGVTVDHQVLEHVAGSAWTNVRYVRVETTSSVSWVAWKEIELFAP